MFSVGIGIDQRDCQSFDTTPFQFFYFVNYSILVQWLDDLAQGADAFIRFYS